MSQTVEHFAYNERNNHSNRMAVIPLGNGNISVSILNSGNFASLEIELHDVRDVLAGIARISNNEVPIQIDPRWVECLGAQWVTTAKHNRACLTVGENDIRYYRLVNPRRELPIRFSSIVQRYDGNRAILFDHWTIIDSDLMERRRVTEDELHEWLGEDWTVL